MNMPRHRFDPDTASDEQKQAISSVVEVAEQIAQAEESLWVRIAAARDVDVPLNYLATVSGRGRATVHRHVQPRPKDASE